ncbi:hypothetical protein GCK72_020229 [Caenorhabditis remanei]|uniref:Serpentine receptor class gamma n=1 Tax=Caenorhabditis remanei TaxID=31234 RepID=A0A6A5GGP3_CAERE|nr:hypothetical protein GCK72_020229 [Caenorhabditis remanei]KAF1753672.1 hypothetical protein GCK72_020229 [Caenorhabditis remanei]
MPCLPDYILHAHIFVICEYFTYHLILMISFTGLVSFEVLAFVGFLIYNSIQQLLKKQISKRTFKMQKKFFIALIIQIGVPMIMLLIPFLYEWMSIMFNYYNQSYNNLSMITESMLSMITESMPSVNYCHTLSA